MAARQRLLVAVTPMGYLHARRALHRRFDLVSAFSMHQALVPLQAGDIDAIPCSIHFDESRMFDLVRLARETAPDTPFVCCRILHSPLSQRAIDALVTTAKVMASMWPIAGSAKLWWSCSRRRGAKGAALLDRDARVADDPRPALGVLPDHVRHLARRVADGLRLQLGEEAP